MDFPRLPTIAAWNCKRGSRSEKDIDAGQWLPVLLASGGTGCRHHISDLHYHHDDRNMSGLVE